MNGLQDVRDAVKAFDAELDQLAQARIEAKLVSELERLSEQRGFSLRRAAPVAVAAAIGLVALSVSLMSREVPLSRNVLAARVIAGFEPEVELRVSMFGTGVDRLRVPANAFVRAEVGPGNHVHLTGPAELTVSLISEERIVLSLESGTLFAEVEHVDGRAFVVEAPNARVVVVGTIFAVDTRDREQPLVSVSRGAVFVENAGVRVEAGQYWSPSGGLAVLEETRRAELAEAVRPFAGDRAGAGVLSVKSEPNPAAVTIAGRRISMTPLLVLLPAGRADVHLEHGAQKKDLGVEITKQSTATLHLTWPEDQVPIEPEKPVPEIKVPKLTAEQLYRRAERAMSQGDDARATVLLRELVQRFATDLLASSALYDLARIAERAGDRRAEREYLEELLARDADPALAEAAQHSLCGVFVAEKADAEALQCLATFHRRFLGSVHDRAALFALAGLAERSGGPCAAISWLEELVRAHPDEAATRALEERRRRCAR
jgi:hypothetical protein